MKSDDDTKKTSKKDETVESIKKVGRLTIAPAIRILMRELGFEWDDIFSDVEVEKEESGRVQK